MIKISQGDILIDSHIIGEEDKREKCYIREFQLSVSDYTLSDSALIRVENEMWFPEGP